MSAAGFPAPALTAVAPRALPARSLVVAGLSTAVEWYDFTLCLYLTTITARVFYGGDGTSVLTTLAVFGNAYVLRPLGAVCFGRLGDRLGRRRVMLTSMTVMAVAILSVPPAELACRPPKGRPGWAARPGIGARSAGCASADARRASPPSARWRSRDGSRRRSDAVLPVLRPTKG
ncbi:hypothetical protein ACFW6E_39425 [Streptomyces olivaceoviridis]|uniref:hypothetical protein n=1 Tax=Streptomyces olivaceoviridis TaxID=1921 RepID=UPI0036B998C6